MKKKKPSVKIGGQIDESLESQFLEQITVVDGKGIGSINTAPLRSLFLQCLHFALCGT